MLDATTGQNGMIQARVFTEIVDVTGIVLTKLDGTAKGGIVISVQRELNVPVKLVGSGRRSGRLGPIRSRAVRGRVARGYRLDAAGRWSPPSYSANSLMILDLQAE